MADHRRRFHPRMAARAGAAGAGPGGRNGSANAAAAPAHGGPAPASSAAAAPAPSSLTSASVRRSLFQSQLTRRPPPAGAAAARPATQGSALGLDGSDLDGAGRGDRPSSASPSPPAPDSPLALLERDRDGELQLLDPPSPTPDELRDMVLDELEENARERQRLAEAITYHQQRSSIAGQPEDLLDTVRASLRAKVSALAEDDWMYETDDRLRPG